jgi:hypothetical protein
LERDRGHLVVGKVSATAVVKHVVNNRKLLNKVSDIFFPEEKDDVHSVRALKS